MRAISINLASRRIRVPDRLKKNAAPGLRGPSGASGGPGTGAAAGNSPKRGSKRLIAAFAGFARANRFPLAQTPLQGAFPPLPVAAAVPISPPGWFPVTVPSASISPARSISEPQKRSKAVNSASPALHPQIYPSRFRHRLSGAAAPPVVPAERGHRRVRWQRRGSAVVPPLSGATGAAGSGVTGAAGSAVCAGEPSCTSCFGSFAYLRCGGSGPEKKTGGDVARPRPVQLSAVSREAAIRIQTEHRVSARRMPQPDSLQAGWHRTDDRPILRGERLPHRRPHPEPLWRTGSAFRQHPHPA